MQESADGGLMAGRGADRHPPAAAPLLTVLALLSDANPGGRAADHLLACIGNTTSLPPGWDIHPSRHATFFPLPFSVLTSPPSTICLAAPNSARSMGVHTAFPPTCACIIKTLPSNASEQQSPMDGDSRITCICIRDRGPATS